MSEPAMAPGPFAEGYWDLRDAEVRLGEVVRRARDSGPQRVTLDGRDTVVVVAAETYDRERQPHLTGRRLVEAMAASPLRDVQSDRSPPIAGPVRDVEL